jgi:tetratricopeptide (TPR) repeat protein
MSWWRPAAPAVLIGAMAVLIEMPVASEAAQGIPGTRAHMAGRAAWEAIREGRNQEAADAFATAIDAEPLDPSLHFGAGLAAYLLGQPTVAQQALERALTLAPGLTPASFLLGDILYRGSDITGAIRVYEAALPHAPDDTRLNVRLERLRREAAAHDGFFESQGSHFVVLFEGPSDEELARRAIDVLEAAYWRIGTGLSVYPERVITVVLYTQEQFRDITRSPDWAAAAYDGRIRVPVRGVRADSQELERVLSHEFTHALIQTIAPRGVPQWLNEGLAVLFEGTPDNWASTQLSKSDRRLTLDRLARSFAGLSSADARLAYAQSAATVRALVDHGGAPAVVAILQDMARGDSFPAAFERRMFLPYDSFVTSLESRGELLR